jgi:hypothetical protein
MTQRTTGNTVVISFTISGLCLLPAWDAILGLTESDKGWEPVIWLINGTVVAWVLAAAGLGIWSRIGWLWRLLAGIVLAICLLETMAFCYNIAKIALKVNLGSDYPLLHQWFFKVSFIFGFAALSIFVRRLGVKHSLTVLESSFRVLAPLPAVLLAAYFFSAIPAANQPIGGELARRVVVVLVFDELDDAAISADMNLLPNFAALKKQGLSASSMYPPANYTSESLPSMLTGETYREVALSNADVSVLPSGGAVWDKLSHRGNVFEDAIDSGRRTAVIGWHLPYCGFVPRTVLCWDDSRYRAPGREVSLPEWMLGNSFLYNLYELRRLASLAGDLRDYSREMLASPRMYRLKRIGSIYSNQKQELLGALDSRRFELVFAHLSCPHAPSLVSSEVKYLDMYQAYANNLRECDALLGAVRRRLNDGGYAEGYALIVTSDHWFRGRDWLDAGKPMGVPAHRRTVPFHVVLSGEPPTEVVTDSITNSRVLRKFIDASSSSSFTYDDARDLLLNQGDSPTLLRSF